jgi:hypothetical protein F3_08441
MKKIFVILLSTFLLFACESKEEKEEIKQIMTFYNYNDYKETVKAIDDYKAKYPNSSRLKDFEKIRQESIEKIKEKEKIEKEKEKQIEKLKKIEAKFNETIKNTYSEYDDFENITAFYSNDIPVVQKIKSKIEKIDYNQISISGFTYGNVNKYPTELVLSLNYKGDDWIFFDRAILMANGERREFNFNSFSGIQEVIGRGEVFESHSITLTKEDILFLKKMLEYEYPKVRLSGKGNYDFYLDDNEKFKLKNMLIIYNKNLDAQIID